MARSFSHYSKLLVTFAFFASGFAVLRPTVAQAEAFECYTFEGCGKGGGRANSPHGSQGNEIRINPSAVPTEKGLGLEGIFFKNEVDVALVQGLGRVGAAISPSNSEDTFFGPPGIELPNETIDRKLNYQKYPSQKVTLAGAMDLIKRKGSGIKSYGLKLGLMGRYNQKTYTTNFGAGLSGLVGPFTFGVSGYKDETQLNDGVEGVTPATVTQYQVVTYNLGLSLGSLLLDYSVLQMKEPVSEQMATVRIATASLLWKKLLITAAQRTEDSDLPTYNFETHVMETGKIRQELFGGLQVYLTKNFMAGVLYNYYLLHEPSITVTLFF